MGELVLLQGESINWQFQYTDQEGVPMDLQYYEVYIAAREELGTLKELFRYNSVANPTVVIKSDSEVGVTNVVVPDTTGFKPGKYLLEMAYKNTVAGLTSKPDHVRLVIKKGIL